MRYLLLIYNAPETWERTSPSERQEITEAYVAFTKEIAESGELLGGDALQPTSTATTVRVRDGKTLSRPPTAASPRPKSSSVATTSSKPRISTRPPRSPHESPSAGPGSIEVRPVIVFPKAP